MYKTKNMKQLTDGFRRLDFFRWRDIRYTVIYLTNLVVVAHCICDMRGFEKRDLLVNRSWDVQDEDYEIVD